MRENSIDSRHIKTFNKKKFLESQITELFEQFKKQH